MSEIINNFFIFRYFPPNLMQNVKSFYVSRDFGYCVLSDNKVYGLGEGIHEKLGYNTSNEKYVQINELCEQNIQQFHEGVNCMIARNDKNEIFSWGWNMRGQLSIRQKPERMSFFDRKKYN